MDKNGVPQDTDSRVAIAAEIVGKAMEMGFETDRLFIDPIILPVKVPDAQQQRSPGLRYRTGHPARFVHR